MARMVSIQEGGTVRRSQRGVITLAIAAALAAAATYAMVPRKFDAGEYGYYVLLDVQAQRLAAHCPYRPEDVAGLRDTTALLQTWVKYRDKAAEQGNAATAAKQLADATAPLPTVKADCDWNASHLERQYARVLTTLGKGK